MGERLCGCAPCLPCCAALKHQARSAFLSSVVFLRWNIVRLPAGFGPNDCHAWLSSSRQSSWACQVGTGLKSLPFPVAMDCQIFLAWTIFSPILVIANVSHVSFNDYCGGQGPWQTVISSLLCLHLHVGKFPIHTWSIWLHARFQEKQLNEILK